MAMQAGSPATPISPHVIGNAFVQQYYHILHETPDQVHKFYQDTSSLGRPGSNEVMEYVTTLHEINKKILSMDFSKYLTEIETADTLLSHKNGVLIVVTGSLTVPEGVCRRFTQSFFLAPQESGGYFVLNDVLRFISERPSIVMNQVVNQETESIQNEGPVAETDPAPVAERPISDHVVVEKNVADKEVQNPTVNGTTIENDVTVEPPVQPPVKVTEEDPKKPPVAAAPPPPAQKDVTKKSYASIVKVMKDTPPPPVAKPKPAPKPVTKAVEGPDKSSVKPSQAAETAPSDRNFTENNASHNEQGYSVFVKNLPFNSTVQMVEEEFSKFGAIKTGGIQVRNNKIDRFCFGFVEFESQQSMQAAIEASPIQMGEKEVYIEEKRTTTRVVNGVVIANAGGVGRFQSGRGVYRGDNFRGRVGGFGNNDNYRGGDNFNRRNGSDNFNRRNDGDNFNRRNDGDSFNRRNDYRNQNEYVGRGRGQNDFAGRGRGPAPGNGYHLNGNSFHQPRPYQNENGRFARANGPKQTPVAA